MNRADIIDKHYCYLQFMNQNYSALAAINQEFPMFPIFPMNFLSISENSRFRHKFVHLVFYSLFRITITN